MIIADYIYENTNTQFYMYTYSNEMRDYVFSDYTLVDNVNYSILNYYLNNRKLIINEIVLKQLLYKLDINGILIFYTYDIYNEIPIEKRTELLNIINYLKKYGYRMIVLTENKVYNYGGLL